MEPIYNSFEVFPNPAQANFIIKLNFEFKILNAELSIYNSLGEIIFSDKLKHPQETININLTKGIYFLKVSSSENQFTKKLIVD